MSEPTKPARASSREQDYEVGYGRPPRHGRFKPGQSGNPKGRRIGSKNILSDLSEELNERIQVREGGRPRSMTKQRIVVKSLVAKAAKGDIRAINAISVLLARVFAQGDLDPKHRTISTDEEILLDLLSTRAARMKPQSSETAKEQNTKKKVRDEDR